MINWVKRIQACRDLFLQNILLSIWDIIDSYDSIICTHIYRENNCQADAASKEGLQMDVGVWKIKEWLDDAFFEYYHRPFIEGVSI